jgi:HEAT repeat protein
MKLATVAGVGVLLLGLVRPAPAGPDAGGIAKRIKDLSGNDASVRLQAVRDLGDLGAAGRPAIRALAGVMTGDRDPQLRKRASRALAQVGPAAVPELIALLKHEDAYVRRLAAEALARIGPEAREAVPALMAALQDSSASVHAAAAEALGELGDTGAARALVMVLTEPEPVRGRAVAALVRLGRDAVPVLCAYLRDKRVARRYQCARVLGLLGPEAAAAVPDLTEALGDKEPLVRRMAMVALGEIGPEAEPAAPVLAQMLAGRDRAQAGLAGTSLVRIGRPAVAPLSEALKSADPAVRLRALFSLRQLGPEAQEAVPALTDALKERDPVLRRMAALALGQVGPPADKAAPALGDLLDDPDRGVRIGAALALAQVRPNDPRGLERLKQELASIGRQTSPAVLAAASDPVRQKQIENYLKAFVVAASADFGIGLKPGAHMVVNQLGPDAIPALVRVLNRLATDPGQNEWLPALQATPRGPMVMGGQTFWFT